MIFVPQHVEIGFYRLRLVKKGPWIPAVVFVGCPWIEPAEGEGAPAPEDWCRPTDRSRPLRALIGGEEAEPGIVAFGRSTTREDYEYRMRLRQWAATAAPDQPEANPRMPVDLGQLPSIF